MGHFAFKVHLFSASTCNPTYTKCGIGTSYMGIVTNYTPRIAPLLFKQWQLDCTATLQQAIQSHRVPSSDLLE